MKLYNPTLCREPVSIIIGGLISVYFLYASLSDRYAEPVNRYLCEVENGFQEHTVKAGKPFTCPAPVTTDSGAMS